MFSTCTPSRRVKKIQQNLSFFPLRLFHTAGRRHSCGLDTPRVLILVPENRWFHPQTPPPHHLAPKGLRVCRHRCGYNESEGENADMCLVSGSFPRRGLAPPPQQRTATSALLVQHAYFKTLNTRQANLILDILVTMCDNFVYSICCTIYSRL